MSVSPPDAAAMFYGVCIDLFSSLVAFCITFNEHGKKRQDLCKL